MKRNLTFKVSKLSALILVCAMVLMVFAGCSGTPKEEPTAEATTAMEETTAAPEATEEAATEEPAEEGPYYSADMTTEEIVLDAAAQGKVGNWGLGNEYEIQALLTKYGQDTSYLSQAFDMDGFDDDSILLASAMTYNELGLVMNSYDGGYGYGDSVSYIDMNDEGVAMLEDNIFCTSTFAEGKPKHSHSFHSSFHEGLGICMC